jgi:hypothetical protein
VRDLFTGQGVKQGLGDMLLPDEVGERLRSPLSIEDLRGHDVSIIPQKGLLPKKKK